MVILNKKLKAGTISGLFLLSTFTPKCLKEDCIPFRKSFHYLSNIYKTSNGYVKLNLRNILFMIFLDFRPSLFLFVIFPKIMQIFESIIGNWSYFNSKGTDVGLFL